MDAVHGALTLSVTLAAIYIFWMGVVEVATRSGLIDKIAKALKPLLKFLFGEQTDEVNSLIATNISANLIGASGAATPAAIAAMEKMAEPEQKKASMPMIMLFVLAASSLQILPTTIIGMLQAHNGVNPESIILPSFIVSTFSTILAVILVKVFSAKKKKRGK